MAAPFPTGSQISVVPQAPQIDPRFMAADPQGALASAAAGLHLGTELANLQNQQSQRELEALQIKTAKAQNDLQQAQITDAQQKLPKVLQAMYDAQMASLEAQRAASANAGALANAQANAGLPQTQADIDAANAAALRATQNANKASPLYNDPGYVKGAFEAGANAAATAWGGVGRVIPRGVLSGAASGALTPSAPAGVGAGVDPLSGANASESADTSSPASIPDSGPVGSASQLPGGKGAVAEAGLNPSLQDNPVIQAMVATKLFERRIAEGTATYEQQQKTMDEALKKFIGVAPKEINEVKDPQTGEYDIPAASKLLHDLTGRYPKMAFGDVAYYKDNTPAVEQMTLATRLFDSLPDALKALRLKPGTDGTKKEDFVDEPSMLAKTIDGFRDETAKGFYKGMLSAAAANAEDPRVAARSALIDQVNAQVQEQIQNDKNAGRFLRNGVPLTAKDTDATILSVVGALKPMLQKRTAMIKSGMPDEAWAYLDQPGVQSVGAVNAARRSAAPATASAPVVTPYSDWAAKLTGGSTTPQRITVNGQPGTMYFKPNGKPDYFVPGQ